MKTIRLYLDGNHAVVPKQQALWLLVLVIDGNRVVSERLYRVDGSIDPVFEA